MKVKVGMRVVDIHEGRVGVVVALVPSNSNLAVVKGDDKKKWMAKRQYLEEPYDELVIYVEERSAAASRAVARAERVRARIQASRSDIRAAVRNWKTLPGLAS